jgi:hypothetical protein
MPRVRTDSVSITSQAVDLVYLTGGATSLSSPHPRDRRRVLFGLEPDVPISML